MIELVMNSTKSLGANPSSLGASNSISPLLIFPRSLLVLSLPEHSLLSGGRSGILQPKNKVPFKGVGSFVNLILINLGFLVVSKLLIA